MKNLKDIKVNAAQLKLIIGENINYDFPTKIVLSKVGKEIERNLPESLDKIINNSPHSNKRSLDPRFDNKHPIILALESIKEKGLNKSIKAAIRNDYTCQNKKAIVGKFKILNDIITDDSRIEIEALLTETHNANVLKFGDRYYK